MYRRHARIARLESIATLSQRTPDPRYHGTPEVAAFLKARTIEEMEAMEDASRFMAAGGNTSNLDPATVALLREWAAVSGGANA